MTQNSRRSRAARTAAVCLALTAALAALTQIVLAHAKLVRSSPQANATLTQAPEKVELWFNEELQAQFNSVTVTDETGKRVDKNNLTLAEGNKKVQVDLNSLVSGKYTIAWKVLSTDQHTLKGQLTFVLRVAAAKTAATPSAPATEQAPAASPAESMSEVFSTLNLSFVRWIEYLAMMSLFGGFIFQLLIARPSVHKTDGLPDGDRTAVLQSSMRRFTRASWVGIAVLAVGVVVALVVQTSMVLDVSYVQALVPSNLFQVLFKTGFGGPWFLQITLLVLLAIVVLMFPRWRRPWLLWAGVLVMTVMFFAVSLMGHAGAIAMEWRSAAISDWLHLVFAGVWVGGLFHLVLNLKPALRRVTAPQRVQVLNRVIPIFTRYAVPSTILIALTGVYNSWIHLDSFNSLWTTAYGKTVLLKVAIFIPMVALGGLNTFVLHPRTKRLLSREAAIDEHGQMSRSFHRSVFIEASLGVAVLLAAAVLAFLTPARIHPGMTESNMQNSNTIQNTR